MRLCRLLLSDRAVAGFYDEQFVVPVEAAADAFVRAIGEKLDVPGADNLLDLLPPEGRYRSAARKLAEWLKTNARTLRGADRLPADRAELLVPIPRPNKIFLLAGNYEKRKAAFVIAATCPILLATLFLTIPGFLFPTPRHNEFFHFANALGSDFTSAIPLMLGVISTTLGLRMPLHH